MLVRNGTAACPSRRQTVTAALLVLVAWSYLLILDIDRPTNGAIGESQVPMEDQLASMHDHPPASFGTVVLP
jgi:hypothetical protein